MGISADCTVCLTLLNFTASPPASQAGLHMLECNPHFTHELSGKKYCVFAARQTCSAGNRQAPALEIRLEHGAERLAFSLSAPPSAETR